MYIEFNSNIVSIIFARDSNQTLAHKAHETKRIKASELEKEELRIKLTSQDFVSSGWWIDRPGAVFEPINFHRFPWLRVRVADERSKLAAHEAVAIDLEEEQAFSGLQDGAFDSTHRLQVPLHRGVEAIFQVWPLDGCFYSLLADKV